MKNISKIECSFCKDPSNHDIQVLASQRLYACKSLWLARLNDLRQDLKLDFSLMPKFSKEMTKENLEKHNSLNWDFLQNKFYWF